MITERGQTCFSVKQYHKKQPLQSLMKTGTTWTTKKTGTSRSTGAGIK